MREVIIADFRALVVVLSFLSGFTPMQSIASDALDESFGSPNGDRPEYAQFAYLRGDWDAKMISIDDAGNRTEIPSDAHVTGYYHQDGKIFQTCFVAPSFFSTDIRAYDAENAEWRAHFLNANAQRWSGFTVKKVGDTIQTIVPGGFSGKEAFDVKTVVSEITENSFLSKVYSSSDGGEKWVQTFELRYTRADPVNGVRINC
ncbi:hypothetical protein [Hyphococcus sp.]|uniref:hypothetical protein n=1 Tax=Hyphococcus sp. TaxID=2038636 RepID=UPI00208A77A5|nr:MAG: hypothetical protein DHS20C04_25690 [Marinicaulis sp.]